MPPTTGSSPRVGPRNGRGPNRSRISSRDAAGWDPLDVVVVHGIIEFFVSNGEPGMLLTLTFRQSAP